jgi:hypothetical protein
MILLFFLSFYNPFNLSQNRIKKKKSRKLTMLKLYKEENFLNLFNFFFNLNKNYKYGKNKF